MEGNTFIINLAKLPRCSDFPLSDQIRPKHFLPTAIAIIPLAKTTKSGLNFSDRLPLSGTKTALQLEQN